MHILYHLPTEYDTINNQYLKDLDDRKDINLEDLRADLRRKYDRLVDSGHIEKINEDGSDKLVKEERALKTGCKKQFEAKCRVCGKIGHKGTDCWTLDSNKEKRPTGYNNKMTATEIISSTAMVTIVTRRAIKKLTAGQNSGTMQTT